MSKSNFKWPENMIWVFFLWEISLLKLKVPLCICDHWPVYQALMTDVPKISLLWKKTAEHQFIDKIYNCLNKIYILNCYCFEVFICKTCKMLKNTKLIRFILNLTKKMWKKWGLCLIISEHHCMSLICIHLYFIHYSLCNVTTRIPDMLGRFLNGLKKPDILKIFSWENN